MIIEGKKNTAFDLMDAAMKLSDLYHKNNETKSISVYYSGSCEDIDVNIFDDCRGRRKILSSVTVYIDEKDWGGTFEEAFEMIEKELEQYE